MERLASILPSGGIDGAVHKGARRHARRWPLDAEIELVEPVHAAGLVINASVGGMRVAVDADVPLCQTCTLIVKTAPGYESTETARVVWSAARPDGYLLGLEFVGSRVSLGAA